MTPKRDDCTVPAFQVQAGQWAQVWNPDRCALMESPPLSVPEVHMDNPVGLRKEKRYAQGVLKILLQLKF